MADLYPIYSQRLIRIQSGNPKDRVCAPLSEEVM